MRWAKGGEMGKEEGRNVKGNRKGWGRRIVKGFDEGRKRLRGKKNGTGRKIIRNVEGGIGKGSIKIQYRSHIYKR